MKEHTNGNLSKRSLKVNFRQQLRFHQNKWKRLAGSLASQRRFYYQQKQRLWLLIRKRQVKLLLRKALLKQQQRQTAKDVDGLKKATREEKVSLTSMINKVPEEKNHTVLQLVPNQVGVGKGSKNEDWGSDGVTPDSNSKPDVYCKGSSRKPIDLPAKGTLYPLEDVGFEDSIANQKSSNHYRKGCFEITENKFVIPHLFHKTKYQAKRPRIRLLYGKPSLFRFCCRIFNHQNRRKIRTALSKEKLKPMESSDNVCGNQSQVNHRLDKMAACSAPSQACTTKGREFWQNLQVDSEQNVTASEIIERDVSACPESQAEGVSNIACCEQMDSSEIHLVAPCCIPSSEGFIGHNNNSNKTDEKCKAMGSNQTPVRDGETQVISTVTDSSSVACAYTNASVNHSGQPVYLQSHEPGIMPQLQLLDHLYYRSLEERAGHAGARTEQPGRSVEKGKEKESQTCHVSSEHVISCIHGFLDEFLGKYGSFIPLNEGDILMKLKQLFHQDFSDRKSLIRTEIRKYQKMGTYKLASSFQVVYNKHVLTLDDLVTLYGENWLNDQVINMYGELIVDAVPDKVHFFNSFFYKQLQTKGYNAVKRWTKKVDLFSKALLLIPVHLEIHWSLLTVDLPNRKICLYDSQGIHFNSCVQNILRYLKTEAGERNCPEFLEGWKAFATMCIPQQKNDSDCGVFVLQYCKCLALGRPFQFSQKDMPEVRKQIYRELCQCRLLE
ncbi:sentrin-specific protease 5 [Callorhinchus milii]|uniref:sentrin-specific protease 5 n=1 Tax=Callorhinchus milii TaxID=7868 RepID=UPI001C3FA6A0|nr:sentrin-specific protease 5 [Callorhinchus milii]